MTYAAPIWHQPAPSIAKAAGPATKLRTIQNKCLRTIAGAYKATPIESLETETFIPPIDLYLDKRCARYRQRTQGTPVRSYIIEQCNIVQRRVQGKRGRRTTLKPTQEELWKKWEAAREERQASYLERDQVLGDWKARWDCQEELRTNSLSKWDQIKRPPDC